MKQQYHEQYKERTQPRVYQQNNIQKKGQSDKTRYFSLLFFCCTFAAAPTPVPPRASVVVLLFPVVEGDEGEGAFLVAFLIVDRFPGDDRAAARAAGMAAGMVAGMIAGMAATGAESERTSFVR